LINHPKAKWKRARKTEDDLGMQTDTSAISIKKSRRSKKKGSDDDIGMQTDASATSTRRKRRSKKPVPADQDEDHTAPNAAPNAAPSTSNIGKGKQSASMSEAEEMSIVLQCLQEVEQDEQPRAMRLVRVDIVQAAFQAVVDGKKERGEWAQAHGMLSRALRPIARSMAAGVTRKTTRL
jgi:hypothetical protein